MRILVNAVLLFLMPFLLKETIAQVDEMRIAERKYLESVQPSIFAGENYLPKPTPKKSTLKKDTLVIPYARVASK